MTSIEGEERHFVASTAPLRWNQWPDGPRERWTDISGDRLVTLKRGSSERKEQKELPADPLVALRTKLVGVSYAAP